MLENNKIDILLINMASGFGGGEFQTVQLIKGLENYNIYFLGKRKGKLLSYINSSLPNVKILNLWEILKLMFTSKSLVIHAHDGRGAHIAGLLKCIFNKKMIITRHVSFPFKRKLSLYAYYRADVLIGVSNQITSNLALLNPNAKTIYGCIKTLEENKHLEDKYFSQPKINLRIAHIANLQVVKNFFLTIELAKNNPEVDFYIVGSGVLEEELKSRAKNIKNIHFIPFTDYVGSIFKNIDLQIVPSHSEGLGTIILEGYQYGIPAIAHAVGGIPEIVFDGENGFLVKENKIECYQTIIDSIIQEKDKLIQLKQNIKSYLSTHDFSPKRMISDYDTIYKALIEKY